LNNYPNQSNINGTQKEYSMYKLGYSPSLCHDRIKLSANMIRNALTQSYKKVK